MSWITYIVIGGALGWFLELLLDMWFWGRRNRRLAAQLAQCHTELQSSKKEIDGALAAVARYKAQEEDFQKCQIDLTALADRHDRLEKMTGEITNKLKQSESFVDQLNVQHARLKEERDDLHDSLEAVDHWVETSMRRRVCDAPRWGRAFQHPKDKASALTRKVTKTAAAHMGRATTRMNDHLSAAKQTFQKVRPKRWWDRGYCAFWAIAGKFNKRALRPQSCSLDTK